MKHDTIIGIEELNKNEGIIDYNKGHLQINEQIMTSINKNWQKTLSISSLGPSLKLM